MNDDRYFMQRAIELSKSGTGRVNPNPLVGAVIVKNGKIIGEGFHEVFGGPHAEINAFNKSSDDVFGTTMYVTLEPCSHFGKTPPCVHEIVRRGIKKVIIGMKDPNPIVSGRGISYLEKNGVEVICGVLEEEVSKLNEIFIKYITTGMPFVILKTAMTLDGKIATRTGESKWISGEASRKYVHEIRNKVSGIMVGVNTIIMDNPLLTSRINDRKTTNPIRIIVDSSGRTPLESNILKNALEIETLIVTTDKISTEKQMAFEEAGAKCLVLPSREGRVDVKILFRQLGDMGIDSVLVEGGGTLNWSMLNDGLVDKVMFFIASKIVGGEFSKTPVEGTGRQKMKEALSVFDKTIRIFGDDYLIEGYVDKGAGLCLRD